MRTTILKIIIIQFACIGNLYAQNFKKENLFLQHGLQFHPAQNATLVKNYWSVNTVLLYNISTSKNKKRELLIGTLIEYKPLSIPAITAEVTTTLLDSNVSASVSLAPCVQLINNSKSGKRYAYAMAGLGLTYIAKSKANYWLPESNAYCHETVTLKNKVAPNTFLEFGVGFNLAKHKSIRIHTGTNLYSVAASSIFIRSIGNIVDKPIYASATKTVPYVYYGISYGW